MKKEIIEVQKNMRAWVIFVGTTDVWWLKFLKKGYKHCFVVISDGYSWITYDPLSSWTELQVQKTPITFDLPEWFAKQGYIVVATKITKRNKLAPLSLYTCVEGIKRVLGIHKVTIVTPYQLYKHLTKGYNNE